MDVGKVLLLAKQNRSTPKKRVGQDLKWNKNYTKKLEMPPVTFVDSLRKIHAVGYCIRELQMFTEYKFMTFGLENLFIFGKFSDFCWITPET